ncbi:MAG: pyridoxal phosphate-dependent aminotransferase [Calditrichota bacterium]
MLSERVQRIGFSSTLRISAKAQQMRAEGIDVIDLSVGEPDFPTPENIKNAAKRALDRNQTKYTANDGIIDLRKAICRRYREEFSAEYEPAHVIVSTGAKQCLYNAAVALCNKGDEVIIPLPYWVSYPHMVNLAKGEPVYVPTREENGFRMTAEDLSRAISPRTKAVILNNPSNPTGSAYDPDQLLRIIDVCLAEQIFIIADEIYEKLVYDGFRFKSVCAFGTKAMRNSLIVSGFSKSYAMTGWRLGYALGPEELIQGMSKVQSHATSNPTSITQWAGVEALNGPQHEISRMRQEFERRRNYVLYRLAAIPHCSCHKPEGAFYVFPNLSWFYDKQFGGMTIRNSSGLAYYLLKHAQVALVPGDSFGTDNFIRVSYATSMTNLEKAMDRIVAALAELKPTVKSRRADLHNTVTKFKDYAPTEANVQPELRNALVAEAESVMKYDDYHEWNVTVGGVVLKLATNSQHLIDFWMENWYPSPLESDIEPHGLLFGVKDAPGREASAFYSPDTRTALLFNSAFYPQLRALALGIVDDIASRMFDTHLVAGSCVDVNGKGIAIIAPSGTGGSTHLAGLLRRKESRLLSVDGFFVRWAGGSPIADSVERKFLLRTDITKSLPELTGLFDRSKLENAVTRRDDCELEACAHRDDCPLERGEPRCYIASKRSQAMLDPYWIGGAEKHVKRAPLSKIILLQKDIVASKVQKPSVEAALRILEEGGIPSGRGGWRSLPYFNRYRLAASTDRMEQLKRQWKRLLTAAPLVILNTGTMTVDEAKEKVWEECR